MACVWRKAVLDNSIAAQRCCLFVQRRHRYKKKWAVNLPTKPPTQLALEHFDAFYRPLFGRQWPAVRVALLSLPKYAAVINSASDSDSSVERLMELGAVDLVQHAASNSRKQRHQHQRSARSSEEGHFASGANLTTSTGRISETEREEDFLGEDGRTVEDSQTLEMDRSVFKQNLETESSDRVSSATSNKESHTQEEITSKSEILESEERNQNSNLDPRTCDMIKNHDDPEAIMDDMKNLLMPDAMSKQGQGEAGDTDLEYFMPTELALSEREELQREEWERSVYQERAVTVSVLEGQPLPSLLTAASSSPLRVMVFPAGDVSDFPRPRADQSGLLNYYLLDAASILPVLALDVRPNDLVLDLCAAPGGKSLALLQILMSQGGHLHSNDVSRSRVKRLKTVLRSYLPADLQEEIITTSEKSGLTFRDPVFNKVLVDVPCNSDRHVLVEDDNNLFRPGRINQRLQITTHQKDLLIAGLKSVKPGGTVVYSTCTLAAVQNQGVVQAACEELWETTDMDVAVEDLTPLRTALSPFFTFHQATPNRMGLLVLPSLVNNFGPSYCCKLRRLK